MADYLKPIAEEERRIEAEEKKKREELERIAKEIAEGSSSVQCVHPTLSSRCWAAGLVFHRSALRKNRGLQLNAWRWWLGPCEE